MAFGDRLRQGKAAWALNVVRTVVTIPLVFVVPLWLTWLMFSSMVVSFSMWCALMAADAVLLVLVWTFDRKGPLIVCGSLLAVCAVVFGISYVSWTDGIVFQETTEDTVEVVESIDPTLYEPYTSENIARLDGDSTLQFSASDNIPRIDCAAALYPLTSSIVTATYPQARVESADQMAEEYGTDALFQFNNSDMGYYYLAAGYTDLFLGALPSDDQVAEAAEEGVEFEYTAVGKEAFVFFVNGDNPVDSLTQQQVRDIYAGRITNWSQVGGNDEEILAYQRNEGSGSQSQMERFMEGDTLAEAPEELTSSSMGGVVRSIASYDNGVQAIGYSFRYYASDLVGDYNIKLLAIDGVQPTLENITNGTYPLTSDFYATMRAGESNTNVASLVEWIRSDQGQELVEKSGYARASS